MQIGTNTVQIAMFFHSTIYQNQSKRHVFCEAEHLFAIWNLFGLEYFFKAKCTLIKLLHVNHKCN